MPPDTRTLCLCNHQRAAHDLTRADKPCTICPCSGFARSAYQPNELSTTTGHRLKKRGVRHGDKPGNLIHRGPGSN
jgi:hypothetical protein